MGSAIGVLKTAAMRVGSTVDEYEVRMKAGERWCTACKQWHQRSAFTADTHRGYGLAATCTTAKNARGRFPRSPERERARSLIGSRVARGKMPHPNTMRCTDCGTGWSIGKPRHEYDHYLGYEGAHAADVEIVCQPCHIARGVRRGEFR